MIFFLYSVPLSFLILLLANWQIISALKAGKKVSGLTQLMYWLSGLLFVVLLLIVVGILLKQTGLL